MVRNWVLAAMAAALCTTAARAAEQAEKPQRQKRTILHFGEDDIRGDITRPDGELVQAPKKVAEESLLRVRRSFLDRALAAPLSGR